jgi:AraC-like DNA-binding protein
VKKKQFSCFNTHGLHAHYYQGDGNVLGSFHYHNEIEVNFLARGEVAYNFASHAISLPLRSLTLFWGGAAHRVDTWKPGGEIHVLHIPLDTFLGLGLPRASFVNPLLRGAFRHEPDPASAIHDEAIMRRWHADLQAPLAPAVAAVRRAALCHELQARLMRLALDSGGVEPNTVKPNVQTPAVNRMLLYITEHSRDPGLTVEHIARHAGLAANYANACFRKACGVSLMRYVNHQRVAHAQRLLATTSAKIIDIALDSGFGSESQFYSVFRGITGASPRGYAKARGKG